MFDYRSPTGTRDFRVETVERYLGADLRRLWENTGKAPRQVVTRTVLMQVTRGYKVELDPNNKQITACKKHAGAARYAYHWGLKRKQEVYQQTGKSISAMELHRELNQLKQTELPWM